MCNDPLKLFRMLAPEFSEIPDEKIFQWFESVKPFISKRKFGSLYNHALVYLTAHKLKMAGEGDSSMGKVEDSLRVSSYSEGDVSIGFSVAQGNNMAVDAEFALTTYGMQYLQLRRSRIISIVSAGEK